MYKVINFKRERKAVLAKLLKYLGFNDLNFNLVFIIYQQLFNFSVFIIVTLVTHIIK